MTSAVLDILFSVLISIGGISISGTSVTPNYDVAADYGISSSAVDSIIDGVPANSSDRLEYLKTLSETYSFLIDNSTPLGAIDDISDFIRDSGFALEWVFIDWLADNKSNVNSEPFMANGCGTIELDDGSKIVIEDISPADWYWWYSLTIYNPQGEILYAKKNLTITKDNYSNPNVVIYDDCLIPNGSALIQCSDTSHHGSILVQCTYNIDGRTVYYTLCENLYGILNADSISVPDSVPSSIGTVDVDGQSVPINSDGTITVDGQTYAPSADGYHIGDNVYNPYFDLSQYSDTALIDLLSRLLEALEGNSPIPADPTDITGFLSNIIDGITGVKNAILDFSKSVTSKLSDIKDLIDTDPASKGYDVNDNWQVCIELFKTKFGYYAIRDSVSNISNDVFGVRVFDSVEDNSIIYTLNGNIHVFNPPPINITFYGNTYNLMDSLLAMGDQLTVVKALISFFLWANFILFVFRSIPDIIKAGAVSQRPHKGW